MRYPNSSLFLPIPVVQGANLEFASRLVTLLSLDMKLKHFSILVTCLLALASCHRAVQIPPAPTALPVLHSPSGKTYTRTPAGPADDEPDLRPQTNIDRARAGGGDQFDGTARAVAKLSIVSAPPESFATLSGLLDTLPSDDVMRALNIPKSADSDRVAQEQRLVTVTAYLYASSKESDDDFHCIVGSDASGSTRFMNVEVSGLPDAASPFLTPLTAARNQFKTFFTNNNVDSLPTQGYEKYNPPIPVKITGSLFFDVDHLPGSIGPVGFRPTSAWEIHPVSDIQFEPQ